MAMSLFSGRRRRNALVAAAATALSITLAGCGSNSGASADGDDLTTVRLALFPSFTSQVLTSVAREEGIFESHGLEIEETRVTSGPVLLSSLLSGEADFTTAPTNVLYPLMDQDLAMVMGGSLPEFNIIRPLDDSGWPNADSSDPMERLRDLKGKTVSVVAKGGVVDLYLLKVLEAAGLEPGTDVTVIATGGAPTAVPAFQNGQVDAMVTFSPTEAMLRGVGEDYEYVLNSLGGEFSPLEDMLVDIWSTTEKFMSENEDTVIRFCSSLREAHEYVKDPAQHETVAAALSEVLGLTSEQAVKAVEAYAQIITPDMPEELFENQAKYAASDVPPELFQQYEDKVFAPCATGEGL